MHRITIKDNTRRPHLHEWERRAIHKAEYRPSPSMLKRVTMALAVLFGRM